MELLNSLLLDTALHFHHAHGSKTHVCILALTPQAMVSACACTSSNACSVVLSSICRARVRNSRDSTPVAREAAQEADMFCTSCTHRSKAKAIYVSKWVVFPAFPAIYPIAIIMIGTRYVTMREHNRPAALKMLSAMLTPRTTQNTTGIPERSELTLLTMTDKSVANTNKVQVEQDTVMIECKKQPNTRNKKAEFGNKLCEAGLCLGTMHCSLLPCISNQQNSAQALTLRRRPKSFTVARTDKSVANTKRCTGSNEQDAGTHTQEASQVVH